MHIEAEARQGMPWQNAMFPNWGVSAQEQEISRCGMTSLDSKCG
jgi:hypothetical protein